MFVCVGVYVCILTHLHTYIHKYIHTYIRFCHPIQRTKIGLPDVDVCEERLGRDRSVVNL